VLTAEITARLHVMADRYARKHLEHKGRHLTAEAEHLEILHAWLARDADAVRRLASAHLEHTLRDLREEFELEAAEAERKRAS
jgi:DNA-binding GntR family transcriptional regulator